jgi:sigma-B regulation protein RsbU (phosphoserine phosphatase)
MADPIQERRHGERVVLSPPLTGRIEGAAVTMVDLGIHGARVRHEGEIPASDTSRLSFEWDGDEITLDCHVVRSDVHPDLEAAAPNIFESGVQFTHPEQGTSRFRRMLQVLAEREEIEHLKTLVEASKLINSSIEPDALFASILTVARKELGVEAGSLYFVDNERQEIWVKTADNTARRELATGSSGVATTTIRLPFGRGLAGTVAATGREIILHDAYADPRFDRSFDQRTGFRTRSVLCVPIRNKESKVVGVLQLLNKTQGSFGEKDLRFLAAISDHMAIAMENAKLHLELVEKDRMERELQLGREIQSRLFPSSPSDIFETTVVAMCHPCYEVGGDYYDFIELPNGDLGLAIGDVSGKGVAAALIMSSVQAALRVASPIEPDLPELVARLNALLYRMARGRKYATFFFGRYDPRTGELRYVNAGHNPPFLCTPDGLKPLDSTGRPIGILPDSSFEEASVVIPQGATLFFYTDGLNEAADPEEEEFGMERLMQLIREASAFAIDEIPARVIEAITAFERGAHATDDKTLVVLRRG